MADYKRILVPVENAGPNNLLTQTTQCFAEAQGVDQGSLRNPQKDVGVSGATSYAFDATRDGQNVEMQTFSSSDALTTAIVAQQSVEVAPPGEMDKNRRDEFTAIATRGVGNEVTAVETRIIDRTNPQSPQVAETNLRTGETTFKVPAGDGSMRQIPEQKADPKLRNMHARANACLVRF